MFLAKKKMINKTHILKIIADEHMIILKIIIHMHAYRYYVIYFFTTHKFATTTTTNNELKQNTHDDDTK